MFWKTKLFVGAESRECELYNGTIPSSKLQIGFENGPFEVETLDVEMDDSWDLDIVVEERNTGDDVT